MAKLTVKQKKFLDSLGVPLDKTFDASYYSVSEYREIMSFHDLWIAYGVTPCKAMGHKLRTRRGHCVECKPATLAYLTRYSENQYIYFAYSTSSRLIKIGITKNMSQREESLNKQKYGGIHDWKIISSAYVLKAGEVETEIHNLLKKYQIPSCTYKDGRDQATYELFKCSKSLGLKQFRKIVSK
jgi:hypothetical protein